MMYLYILPILILLTEYTLKDTHLGSGLRYYTTVTACNTATLCTSVTSDGVVIDNSPPTTGVVQDGTGLYDTGYQSIRYQTFLFIRNI